MNNHLYIQLEQCGYMCFQTPGAQSITAAVQMLIEACNSIGLDVANVEINRLELRDEAENTIEKAQRRYLC